MRFTEQQTLSPQVIDRDAGVIGGVRILGAESKNGRRYSQRAMQAAARMYEGVAVNVDHSPDAKDRSVSEAFGWLSNVRESDGAVFGDLNYLKTHPQAPVLLEVAERNPNRLGLSHHAEGTVRMDGGVTIVETIERVHSVDLVQTPATNTGLFESRGHMTIREAFAKHPKLAKILEGEGMGGYGDKMLPEMDDASGMAEVELSGLEVMVLDALRGEGDIEAKLAKVAEIMKAFQATEPTPEGEMADKPDAEMAESLNKIAARLDGVVALVESLNAERKARELIESKGREVTADRIAAVAMADEGKRVALVESWPVQRGNRPGVSAPANGGMTYPKDSSGFLAAIRS